MNGQYRLIHFVPDHFNGTRYAIGGLIATEDGVRVALARLIPGAECLGDDASFMLLRHNLDLLRQLRSFDELPMTFGPHIVLDSPRKLERAVVDPVAWLQDEILPRPLPGPSQARKRGRTRTTIGRDFLQQYVQGDLIRSFQVQRDLPMLNGSAKIFPSISQSVVGQDELILMEPIAPELKNTMEHVKTIAHHFAASRFILEKENISVGVNLLAYITPDSTSEQREEITEYLSLSAHKVYDMDSARERREFIRRINEVGSSGRSQTVL